MSYSVEAVDRHVVNTMYQNFSYADLDPDPVVSGPFWSVPYPDAWDRTRIRNLALINDPI
jgi:hypothetical protein